MVRALAMPVESSLPVSTESDAQKLLHYIFLATDIRTNRTIFYKSP